MPEPRNYDEHPELLLSGADRPRPLPVALRAQLEEVLGAAAARPLSPEVRDRLESRLVPSKTSRWSWRARRAGAAEAGPAGPARTWDRRTVVVAVGVAAAIAVLAGVVVPGMVRTSRPSATAARSLPAAGPRQAPLRKAAAPPVRHSPGVPYVVAPRVTATTSAAAGTPAPVAAPASRSGPAQPPAAGALAAGGIFSVDKVNPRSGPTAGGNLVVIEGRGFNGVDSVVFGAVAATSVEVVSPTEVKVRAPAHAAGAVLVRAKGADGTSSASPGGRYVYTGP